MKFSFWADNASSKNQRTFNKTQNNRHEKPSFGLLVKVFQETPLNNTGYCYFLGCSLEVREVPIAENAVYFKHTGQRPLSLN